MHFRAIGQHRINRQDIGPHRSIADRAAPAAVVGGHAADGGAGSGRDIDGKPQAMLFQLPVEVVQYDTGFDGDLAHPDIQRQDPVEIFGAIDDQARIDGLAALAGAAATGTPSSRAIWMAAAAPSMLRGTTTPAGIIW